jgi:hypothetical protein
MLLSPEQDTLIREQVKAKGARNHAHRFLSQPSSIQKEN